MTTTAATGHEPLTEERTGLVERNVGFAFHMARYYARDRPHLLEEFESACLAGLEEAARGFEAGKGVAFTTYALWWMRNARNGVIKQERPRGYRSHDNGPVRVEPSGQEKWDVVDTGRPPCGPLDDADQVDHLLKRLTDRERAVVRLHYWEGMKLDDVARALGVGRDAAMKDHRKALAKMAAPQGVTRAR